MKKLRVPKGVRVDGRAFGGRYVTLDRLIDIAATTDAKGFRSVQSLVLRELRKAERRHQQVADKFVDDPRRYRDARTERRHEQQDLEIVADALESFRGPPRRKPARTPARAGAGKSRGRKSAKSKAVRKRRAPSSRPKAPTPVEWEVGFSYAASEGSKDVDVNLRIRRVDGRGFAQSEARGVLSYVADNAEVPAGYLLAGISWHRPQWGSGWRQGDVSDLSAFWAPMYTERVNPRAWKLQIVRLGAVRDDDVEGDE